MYGAKNTTLVVTEVTEVYNNQNLDSLHSSHAWVIDCIHLSLNFIKENIPGGLRCSPREDLKWLTFLLSVFTRAMSSVYIAEFFTWHWLLRGHGLTKGTFICHEACHQATIRGLPSRWPGPCTAPPHVTSRAVQVGQWELCCWPRSYFSKNALPPHCCSFIEWVQKPPP